MAAGRYDIARFGAEFPRFSPRQADLLMVVGTINLKQAPILQARLRADGRAEVGDRLRRLRLVGRLLRQLRGAPGHRPHHPGGRLHPRLPAAARAGARRADAAAGEDPGAAPPSQGGASRSAARAGASSGSEESDVHGGPRSARERFEVGRGRRRHLRHDGAATTPPSSRREKLLEVATFLRDDPRLRFDMPIDVTAVDYLGPAAALRGGLPPLLACGAASASGGSRCPATADVPIALRGLAGRQLVRARGLRHVRRALRRPPRPAPAPCTRSSWATRCARTTPSRPPAAGGWRRDAAGRETPRSEQPTPTCCPAAQASGHGRTEVPRSRRIAGSARWQACAPLATSSD